MPVKTKKDLQTENTELKERLNMLQHNFENFLKNINYFKQTSKKRRGETKYAEIVIIN